jgi:hypothetical protein
MSDYCNEDAMDELQDAGLSDVEHISLCETLDRVLNKGVVIAGEIMISVANIDLIYLGLQLVLTSVETARQQRLPGVLNSQPQGGKV